MAATKKQDLCPKCYLEQGQDVAIVYNLGSTQPLKCKNDHVFDDREELSTLTRQMIEQKKALAPKAEVQPPKDEPLPPVDVTNKAGNSTNPLPTEGVLGMNISPIDMVRLTTLLGMKFQDSSTLFGLVFAVKQELANYKELLQRAEAARKVANSGTNAPPNAGGAPRAIGGDVAIQLVIPERHVASLKDIADANGMDITRYMNAKVEDGLDNMWYY